MTPGTKIHSSEKQAASRGKNQTISDDIIKIKVPLHMVDFRFIIAIIAISTALMFVFIIELFYLNIWTELSIYLISSFMLGIIYFLTRYEISIYSSALGIKNPLFREMVIPVDRIAGISDFNNFLYKHKKLYFSILGIIIFLLTTLSFQNNYRTGTEGFKYLLMSTFPPLMCIILFFNAYRMSHYVKAIKVDIDPGEIQLYPENEEKYLLLKEKLESLLR